MRVIILGLMLSLLPVLAQGRNKPGPEEAKLAQANAKPAPEEVRRVLRYYMHGKDLGPVLIEAKLCRNIIADGEDKNECGGDLTAQPIAKGEQVYLWMAYMVPEGEEPQNIVVYFEKGGLARKVETLQVSSQLRNRTWLKTSFDASGPWKLRVVRDTGSGGDDLGTVEITVK